MALERSFFIRFCSNSIFSKPSTFYIGFWHFRKYRVIHKIWYPVLFSNGYKTAIFHSRELKFWIQDPYNLLHWILAFSEIQGDTYIMVLFTDGYETVSFNPRELKFQIQDPYNLLHWILAISEIRGDPYIIVLFTETFLNQIVPFFWNTLIHRHT